MSIDYTVYVGPYIEVKTKGLTRKVTKEVKCCINPDCSDREKPQTYSKFCPSCGGAISRIAKEVEQTIYPIDLLEENDLNDQLYPDNAGSCDSNGDTEIFFPAVDFNRKTGGSLKYDEIWIDLSDVKINEEIDKVKKECDRGLKVLSEAYGVEPVIKWGLIGTVI